MATTVCSKTLGGETRRLRWGIFVRSGEVELSSEVDNCPAHVHACTQRSILLVSVRIGHGTIFDLQALDIPCYMHCSRPRNLVTMIMDPTKVIVVSLTA